jgi:hypothetical protein
VVEIRESELTLYTNSSEEQALGIFQFYYELSLSSQPQETVIVRVEIKQSRNISCIHQDGRLLLMTPELAFSRDSYNTPQAALAAVNVSNAYQGSLSVIFTHNVETEDEDWQAPFLLPVSLTLLDDDVCTVGAAQYEDENNVRICQCEEGHFVKDTDPNFCESATCEPCVDGMICHAASPTDAAQYRNKRLESLLIKSGMYRLDAQSTVVVECPIKQACVGDGNAGDSLCANGHSGPMCQACLAANEVTYVWSDEKCVLCESGQEGTMYGLLVAVLIVLISIAWCVVRHKDKAEKIGRRLNAKWERFNQQILTKYKIVVKLLQTLAKITTLYPFTLPAIFVSSFNKINIVDLDVNVLPFNCVVTSTNFHHKLLLMTVAPLGFVGYVGIVYLYQRHRIKRSATAAGSELEKRDLNKLEADCLYVVLVFLYTIFSLVSTTIIQTFHYDGRLGNGELYLIADYTITASDPIHRNFVVYAWIMAVVYCLGIPGASLYLLRRHKEAIKELQTCVSELLEKENKKKVLIQKESQRENTSLQLDNTKDPLEIDVEGTAKGNSQLRTDLDELEDDIKMLQNKRHELLWKGEHSSALRGLRPLYQDYESEWYWFEIVQFGATLFLAAIAASLPVNSASVVFLALLVAGGMLLMFANFNPYIDGTDGILAQMGQLTITLALLVGLLALSSSQEHEENSVFGWLLLLFTSIAVFAPAALIANVAVRLILSHYKKDPDLLPGWLLTVVEILLKVGSLCTYVREEAAHRAGFGSKKSAVLRSG